MLHCFFLNGLCKPDFLSINKLRDLREPCYLNQEKNGFSDKMKGNKKNETNSCIVLNITDSKAYSTIYFYYVRRNEYYSEVLEPEREGDAWL